MPDAAAAIIAALYAITAVCVSSIGIPQTWALVARWRSGDGLQMFRLLWVLLMAALCLGTIYRAAVWVDLTLFDQAVLGAIDRRWPLELGIAFLVTAASAFGAWLYWRTRAGGRP